MASEIVNKQFVTKIMSQKVYEIRTDFNLTQVELAKMLNVDQSIIASIETGRREIRIKELYLIAINLKVNINWLFSLSNTKLDAKVHTKHLENVEKNSKN